MITLRNQALKEIVIERGHFIKDKMFNCYWGFVTSKIFDREFLEKNNISFSDEIPYAEDIQFLCRVADTDIAKARFSDVKSFRENVRVTTYDDYAPLIELTTKVGEKNIFTSYPVLCYARTSGSMGQPKYIPYTEPHIDDFVGAFEKILDNRKSFVLFESLPRTIFNDAAYLDTISGAVLYYYAQKNGEKLRELFTSPYELLFPKEVADTIHARLLFALLCPDIEQIIAPFTLGILGGVVIRY